jgi:hypothetical protein
MNAEFKKSKAKPVVFLISQQSGITPSAFTIKPARLYLTKQAFFDLLNVLSYTIFCWVCSSATCDICFPFFLSGDYRSSSLHSISIDPVTTIYNFVNRQ